MKTTYYKDKYDGWVAKSTAMLTEENGENRELDIGTRRSSNGNLVTSATVHWVGEHGSRTHAFSFGATGGDYSQRIKTTDVKRLSEKVLREQHEYCLTHLPQIRETAVKFYLQKSAPKCSGLPNAEMAEA